MLVGETGRRERRWKWNGLKWQERKKEFNNLNKILRD